jgi:hypothetical protein
MNWGIVSLKREINKKKDTKKRPASWNIKRDPYNTVTIGIDEKDSNQWSTAPNDSKNKNKLGKRRKGTMGNLY